MKKLIKCSLVTGVFVLILSVFIFKHSMLTENEKSYNYEIPKDNTIQGEYEITSYVTQEMKKGARKNVCSLAMRYEYTPEKMYELCTDIAIIKVISKDYMDPTASMLGMTYGKLLVNNTIFGNLSQGQIVKYEKPGGYIDLETYNKSRPIASQEKRKYLRREAGLPEDMSNEYINILAETDIELEEGKTYLAYLTYNEYDKAYEIIGLGNGLREVDIPQENISVTLTKERIDLLKIKNNETGKWENLEIYIEENINRFLNK